MNWLGVDIGGANLKLADGREYAESHAFALWREPEALAQRLRTCMAEAPPSDHLVVTMTGELADCFDSKAAGVQFILDAVESAADGRHTRVYLHTGKMVTPLVARRRPMEVAAANWHALAQFSVRFGERQPTLLLDVGSTTTDIVQLGSDRPAVCGLTDTERLLSGELVYTGVARTPVCSVVSSVPYRGQHAPVAGELFATMYDVYLLLSDLAEDLTDRNTADSRPASKAAARVRMGRMICADSEHFNHRDAVTMAQAVAECQVGRIAAAVKQVVPSPGELARVVLSGQGEFVAQRVLETLGISPEVVSLARELGRNISRCAPAYALAVMAREAAEP